MLMKLLAVPMALIAIMVGILFNHAPWLFGQRTGIKAVKNVDYRIFNRLPHLDDELFGLAETLGSNFGQYRNHCLRVLSFTFYLYPEEEWKKLPKSMELAAIAVAYHDVGLWVKGGKLDYLQPSMETLEEELQDKYTSEEIGIMKEIISQHHRLNDYTSSQYGPTASALINAVRKADLADFSLGIFRSEIPIELIELAYDEIPLNGFHKMLLSMPFKLSSSLGGQLDILKIFKW